MKRRNPYPVGIRMQSHQHPFGMLMKKRTFSNEEYRYGFNSQEKDDEVAGSGNMNTAEYWEYDCRLGRRWNLDPVIKVFESPYASFANNPIWFADPFGLDSTERAAAVGKANDYKQQNNNGANDSYQLGARQEPGGKTDCQGMVDKCVMAAGVADPDKQNQATGVLNIVKASTKVNDMNNAQAGNAVVIDWSKSQKGFGHIGLITKVNRDANGNVVSLVVVHSGGSQGSGRSGPMEATIYINPSNKYEYYTDKLINGIYKWDSPDNPEQDNTANPVVVVNPVQNNATNSGGNSRPLLSNSNIKPQSQSVKSIVQPIATNPPVSTYVVPPVSINLMQR